MSPPTRRTHTDGRLTKNEKRNAKRRVRRDRISLNGLIPTEKRRALVRAGSANFRPSRRTRSVSAVRIPKWKSISQNNDNYYGATGPDRPVSDKGTSGVEFTPPTYPHVHALHKHARGRRKHMCAAFPSARTSECRARRRAGAEVKYCGPCTLTTRYLLSAAAAGYRFGAAVTPGPKSAIGKRRDRWGRRTLRRSPVHAWTRRRPRRPDPVRRATFTPGKYIPGYSYREEGFMCLYAYLPNENIR